MNEHHAHHGHDEHHARRRHHDLHPRMRAFGGFDPAEGRGGFGPGFRAGRPDGPEPGRGHRHGPRPFEGGRGRGGHFRRARRGDVRAAALLLLDEQPRNGYQIIQELADRTADAWRPSPGSVYPILAQLEDEGLVTSAAQNGGKLHELTDAGRRYVEDNRAALGTPWQDATGGLSSAHVELRQAAHQLLSATRQVGVTGTAGQLAEATRLLGEARRALYRLLAEEPTAAPSDQTEAPGTPGPQTAGTGTPGAEAAGTDSTGA